VRLLPCTICVSRRQQLGELELANPTVHQTRTNAKIMALATLSTLPIALAQAAVAWLSVWVKYDGAPLERNPRSVLGIFFAVYRYADDPQTQCASAADSSECVLCAFPAAAVAVQAVWVVPFLIALWVVYQRLTLKAVNVTLARRLFLFCALVTSFSLSGTPPFG
jgi:hypothetical protein